MKQGLTTSWTLDSSDNKSANVTIDLFLGEEFYLLLTPPAGVPVNDLKYTYQYTSPNYISAGGKYIVRIFDGSGNEASSDAFSIFDTDDFVQATSTVKTTGYPKTAAIRNGTSPSHSPSLSVLIASPAAIQTPTSTPTPTASHNAGSYGYGERDAGLSMGIVAALFPLLVLGFVV